MVVIFNQSLLNDISTKKRKSENLHQTEQASLNYNDKYVYRDSLFQFNDSTPKSFYMRVSARGYQYLGKYLHQCYFLSLTITESDNETSE